MENTYSDPLSSGNRSDSDSDEKTTEYFRGFFTAEKRRPVVNMEPTFGQMIVSGAISALPIMILAFFVTRSAKVMNKMKEPGATKKGTVIGDAMAEARKMMDPMGNKDFTVSVRDKKFKDVIGIPEARDEVKQYVDFLREPNRFTRLGARLPKGCLLTGQPGTGKTLLAKAVAGEADVPFFSCSGADFIEVYVGSGPKRVRDLFEAAKKVSPSVIFVDEIDAIGSRAQKAGGGNVSGEENRTINQLLADMDGLQSDEAVVVFAATNFPDNLDKALLREGRFDRKVEIPMPDLGAREEIFHHYLNSVITGDPDGALYTLDPDAEKQGQEGNGDSNQNSSSAATTTKSTSSTATTSPGKDLSLADPTVSNKKMATELAALTPGVSPATIATIVNEAALAAAISGDKTVTMKRLLPAIDDVLIGRKHRQRMNDSAAARVALHEAGHATVAWMLSQQQKVIKLSITPRGNAGGFTQQLGREVLEPMTDLLLFTDICVMLGGRCAEMMRYPNLTSGAQDDLQRATRTALNQFLAFGFSRRVGLLSFDYQRLENGRMYQLCSETTQSSAEQEAKRLVGAAFEYTSNLLRENEAGLMKLTELLIQKKELLEADIASALGPRPNSSSATKMHPLAKEALDRFISEASRTSVLDEVKGGVEKGSVPPPPPPSMSGESRLGSQQTMVGA